jgi:hypothetical protein
MLLWGTFGRGARVEVTLTVAHPPATSASQPTALPVLWTAPLKLHANTSLVVSGPSKLAATCEGPVLHPNGTSTDLVDACSVAEAQGIAVAVDSPTATDCLDALLAHRDGLVAAAKAAAGVNGSAVVELVQLPAALQWPPLVSPWPPENAATTACPSGDILAARHQECISCLWGRVTPGANGECPPSVCMPETYTGHQECT